MLTEYLIFYVFTAGVAYGVFTALRNGQRNLGRRQNGFATIWLALSIIFMYIWHELSKMTLADEVFVELTIRWLKGL